MPGGAVGNQGIPPHGTPPLGDTVAFQDDVGNSPLAQVLAHRYPGLARADDEDLNLLD
ncbi:hypothetical protein D3C73_1474390 [compost metagenome]